MPELTSLTARSTIILVAYCKDLEIEVPENMVTRIYVCGKSEVRIECKGKCNLIEYGEDNDVKIIGYDDANGASSLITTKKGALRVMPTKEEVETFVAGRLK